MFFTKVNFSIKTCNEILSFNEQDFNRIKKLEKDKELRFYIPDEFQNNNLDKTTYKVGFLFLFLKNIYLNEKISFYYNKINEDYEVFLSERQMQRHFKRFKEKDIFKKYIDKEQV